MRAELRRRIGEDLMPRVEIEVEQVGASVQAPLDSPLYRLLEEVVVGWLRDGLGLPGSFDGLLNDTASTSTLIALAAAREAAGLQAAADGLAAHRERGLPAVYASAEAHSSVEKACMTLGLGRAAIWRIPVDDVYRMRVDLLERAIEEDRAGGDVPVAIVATIGTTSSTAVDPVAAIAGVAERERTWLHVDAAYAGSVALVPQRRTLGCGRSGMPEGDAIAGSRLPAARRRRTGGRRV